MLFRSPLSELQGITGNTLIDELLHQGPAARLLSTGRTLADERKDIGTKLFNLLSPAQVTDVNPETRNNAIRRIVEEKLGESPNVSSTNRLYVRPENLQNLSPEEMLLLRVYTDEEKKAQAAARLRKKQSQ